MPERVLSRKVMSQRELSKQLNQAAIVEAAKRIIAQKGLEKSSLSDIVQLSGLSTGTFYNYFNNKDELFVQVSIELLENIQLSIKQAKQGTRNPSDYTSALVNNILKVFFLDDINLQLIINNQHSFRELIINNNRWKKFFSELEADMDKAIDKGVLKPLPSKLFVRASIGAIFAVFATLRNVTPSDKHHKTEEALAFIQQLLGNMLKLS